MLLCSRYCDIWRASIAVKQVPNIDQVVSSKLTPGFHLYACMYQNNIYSEVSTTDHM